jgi:hypothetical protein
MARVGRRFIWLARNLRVANKGRVCRLAPPGETNRRSEREDGKEKVFLGNVPTKRNAALTEYREDEQSAAGMDGGSGATDDTEL